MKKGHGGWPMYSIMAMTAERFSLPTPARTGCASGWAGARLASVSGPQLPNTPKKSSHCQQAASKHQERRRLRRQVVGLVQKVAGHLNCGCLERDTSEHECSEQEPSPHTSTVTGTAFGTNRGKVQPVSFTARYRYQLPYFRDMPSVRDRIECH